MNNLLLETARRTTEIIAGNVTAPVILGKATPRRRPQMELWTQALDMRGKLENDYLSNI